MDLDIYTKKGIDLAFREGPKLLGAILFLIVGLYLAKLKTHTLCKSRFMKIGSEIEFVR